ncbi:MAG: hypothetical protein QF583_03575, partial [Rhodospirillales bacterium]|nr:hypothetical protein [Rhodospirillales bacterium]
MADDQEELPVPKWFFQGVPKGPEPEQLLISVRDELYRALSGFYTHAAQYIRFLLLTFGAVVAMMGYSYTRFVDDPTMIWKVALLVGSGLMVILGVVAVASFRVLYLNYHVYLWAMVFALRCHWHSNLKATHPWLARNFDQLVKWNNTSLKRYLIRRTWNLGDAFLMIGIMLVVLVTGILETDEETAAALYDGTQNLLAAAGLPAYEISNHARPGGECRHNLG